MRSTELYLVTDKMNVREETHTLLTFIFTLGGRNLFTCMRALKWLCADINATEFLFRFDKAMNMSELVLNVRTSIIRCNNTVPSSETANGEQKCFSLMLDVESVINFREFYPLREHLHNHNLKILSRFCFRFVLLGCCCCCCRSFLILL